MQKLQGFVENGNLVITVGGVPAAQRAQGSYPQAQVAVYLAGTTTLAPIYADNPVNPTPKANPFTAQTNGYWYFYAAGGHYDVTFSGGGLAAPLTFGDVLVASEISTQGIGQITKDGTVLGPSGWTCTHPEVGAYTIQHNLNYDPAAYVVMVCPIVNPTPAAGQRPFTLPPESSLILVVTEQAADSFTIVAVQGSSLTQIDAAFNFALFYFSR